MTDDKLADELENIVWYREDTLKNKEVKILKEAVTRLREIDGGVPK